jgi:hypothetical protein
MASELEVGKVRVSPANITAELQLYRDDSTINAAGTAIGDINFGGGDADNDNAARLRVKSDAAWTASSSPTAFEFQTCPSGSESPQTRLVIDSDGQVGINVAPAAKLDVHDNANNQRLIRISHPTSPTEAGGYLGFASDGTTDNNLVVLGVQYSGSYYDALTIQRSTRLATFANDVAYDNHARVYHGNLPSTGPSHSSHDKYNFNFTFSGTYGVALITLDIAAGIGEVAAGRYTLAVSCTANSGVTTQLMGSVTEVFKHNLSALTFADSGSSNRTFTLSVERTVTAENWGPNANYKLEVTNNHQTLTLNSVTAST